MADLSDIKSLIRSILISCPTNMTIEQLSFDFKAQEGHPIPFRDFNCADLRQFLMSIPDTVEVSGMVVSPVQNKKTAHVDELVTKQKTSKPKSLAKPKYVPPFRRRAHAANSLAHRQHSKSTQRPYRQQGSSGPPRYSPAPTRYSPVPPRYSPVPPRFSPVPRRASPVSRRTSHDTSQTAMPMRPALDEVTKAKYIKDLQEEVRQLAIQHPDGVPLHQIQDDFIVCRPSYKRYLSDVEEFLSVSKDLFICVRGMVYLNTRDSVDNDTENKHQSPTLSSSESIDIVTKPPATYHSKEIPPRFQIRSQAQAQDFSYENRQKNGAYIQNVDNANSPTNNNVYTKNNNSEFTSGSGLIEDKNTHSFGYSRNSSNSMDAGGMYNSNAGVDKYFSGYTSENDNKQASLFNGETISFYKGSGSTLGSSVEKHTSSDEKNTKFNELMEKYYSVFREKEAVGSTNINIGSSRINSHYQQDTDYGESNKDSVTLEDELSSYAKQNEGWWNVTSDSQGNEALRNHGDTYDGRLSRNSISSEAPSDHASSISIGDKMENNLRHLTRMNPDGILSSQLQNKYKETFGVDLDYRRYGPSSVIEFASSLRHIFICRKYDSADWLLYGVGNPKARRSGISPTYFEPILPEFIKGNIEKLVLRHPGVTLDDLMAMYKDIYGQPLTWEKYGFDSLESLLISMSDRTITLMYIHKIPLVYHKSMRESIEDYETLTYDIELHQDIMRCYPPDVFALPKMLPTIEMPEESNNCKTFTIQISDVYTPAKFYYQPSRDPHLLEDLMNDMQDFYNTYRHKYKMRQCTIIPAQYCVAIYRDDDVNEWTRAKITQIVSKDVVEIFFFDYGTTEKVETCDLCYLHKMFAKIPAQARRGCLAGIRPKYLKWTLHSGRVLLNLVKGKVIVAIAHKVTDETGIDYLSLFETTSEKDVDVAQYLIKEGMALALTEEDNVEEPKQEEKQPKTTDTPTVETKPSTFMKTRISPSGKTRPVISTKTVEHPQPGTYSNYLNMPPPGFKPLNPMQSSANTPTIPASYVNTSAWSQYAPSMPPPGFTANSVPAATVYGSNFNTQGYMNTLQQYGYSNYPALNSLTPSFPASNLDPSMQNQFYNSMVYMWKSMMMMAQTQYSMNMQHAVESGPRLTEVETRCTFSTHTSPSPVEISSSSCQDPNEPVKLSSNLRPEDYSDKIVKPKPVMATKTDYKDIDTSPRTVVGNDLKVPVTDSPNKTGEAKNKINKVEVNTESVQSKKDKHVQPKTEPVQEKRDRLAQSKAQSPKKSKKPVEASKNVEDSTHTQESSEKKETSEKAVVQEKHQQKNKTPINCIKIIDISGVPYHVVLVVDTYYMCTSEIATNMCSFSGYHVLLRVLESTNEKVPFLIVNKSTHENVFQALRSSDLIKPKKKDTVMSFHLTPLNDVPRILEKMNLLHSKLRTSLELLTEALRS